MTERIEALNNDFSDEKRLHMVNLLYDDQGIFIVLEGEKSKNQYQVHFKSSLHYSCSEESQRLKLIEDHPVIGEKGHVFELFNSKLIVWLKEQSYDILNTKGLRHFMVCTSEQIMEVISYDNLELKMVGK